MNRARSSSGRWRVASHAYDSTTLDAINVFSRSNAARWRSGESTARRPRSWRERPARDARGANPRMVDDRREVDVGHVVRPVDGARVERERRPVVRVERRPERLQAGVVEHRFGLGVRAVELDVAEGALGLALALFELGGQVGPLPPHGKRCEHALSRVQRAQAALELALHATPSREGPLADDDGLTVVVVQRVLGEVVVHEVDEAAVAQRVAVAGRRLEHRGPVGRGPDAATAMMAATT